MASRRILAVACKARDLTAELEASIAATADGGRFVDPAVLPSETVLHATHARLWRGARETTRVYFMPPEPISLVVNPDDLPFK